MATERDENFREGEDGNDEARIVDPPDEAVVTWDGVFADGVKDCVSRLNLHCWRWRHACKGTRLLTLDLAPINWTPG